MTELPGRCIAVVGASSGIGAALARAALAAGARVALMARRQERLAKLAAGAEGAWVLPVDVRSPGALEGAVERAAQQLGGLDALVYAAGITPPRRLADADPEHWRAVFETNCFGAVHATRAALPRLSEGGLVAWLSSDSVGRPREGLAAYSASKAALDEVLRAFREEHPERRFLRVVLGPTRGTEAFAGVDPALAAALLPRWRARGFMTERQMPAQELGALLAELLGLALARPEIALEDLRLEPTGGWL